MLQRMLSTGVRQQLQQVFLDRWGGGDGFVTLPTTPVHDMAVHPRDNELVIGTHGRSVFVLDAGPIRERARN